MILPAIFFHERRPTINKPSCDVGASQVKLLKMAAVWCEGTALVAGGDYGEASDVREHRETTRMMFAWYPMFSSVTSGPEHNTIVSFGFIESSEARCGGSLWVILALERWRQENCKLVTNLD